MASKHHSTHPASRLPAWPLPPDSSVMAFRGHLPMQQPYGKQQFYVRPCYDQYYQQVMHRLQQDQCDMVTVTGTPGIGKSLFLTYFYERYRVEFPNEIIVAAAFDEHSATTNLAMWWPRSCVPPPSEGDGRSTPTDLHDVIAMARASELPCIVLFDGPPDFVPAGVKTVCCTGTCTSELLAHAATRIKAATLCMPLWSREELVHAMEAMCNPRALHYPAIEAMQKLWTRESNWFFQELLTLGHRAINERFDVFGGVADLCLNGDPNGFYQRRMASTVTKASNARDLQRLLATPLHDKQENFESLTLRQRLIHRMPPTTTSTDTTNTTNTSSSSSNSSSPVEAGEEPEECCLASFFVEKLFHDRVLLLPQDERESLLRWMQCPSPLRSHLDDFVWTSRAHSRLIQDGTFTWRTTRPEDSLRDWLTVCFPCNTQLMAGEPDDPLQPHCYHPCSASFMSSVDGYCLLPQRPPLESGVEHSTSEIMEESLLTTVLPDVVLFVFVRQEDFYDPERKFDVSGTAISRVLHAIEMLDKARDNYLNAAIVFAISNSSSTDPLGQYDHARGSGRVRLDTNLFDPVANHVAVFPQLAGLHTVEDVERAKDNGTVNQAAASRFVWKSARWLDGLPLYVGTISSKEIKS